MKKKTFDQIGLSEKERFHLNSFEKRRTSINKFINENSLNLTSCPGCGFPSFTDDWFHDICCVCNWEHDGQDDPHEDEIWGGPNYELSLTENRLIICYILERKAEIRKGRLIEDPIEILKILEKHEERMNCFDDDKMSGALRDDPIWMEWEKESNEILNNLVVSGK